MSNIDIESPGADEAALKAALGALGMPVLLASGAVTSPVSYISLALPAGYQKFELDLSGVFFNVANDFLMGAMSFDSGATWLFDADTFAAYTDLNVQAQVNTITNAAGIGTGIGAAPPLPAGQDTLLSIVSANISDGSTLSGVAPAGLNGTFYIDPGDNARVASLRGQSLFETAVGDQYFLRTALISARPLAHVGRVTNIALLPYGNGDMPPTSTETITAATYRLRGLL